MPHKLIYQLRSYADCPFFHQKFILTPTCLFDICVVLITTQFSLLWVLGTALCNTLFIPGLSLNGSWSSFPKHTVFLWLKTTWEFSRNRPCLCWQWSSYLQKAAHVFKIHLKHKSVSMAFELESCRNPRTPLGQQFFIWQWPEAFLVVEPGVRG